MVAKCPTLWYTSPPLGSRQQEKSHPLSHTQPTCRVNCWPLFLPMPQKGATPQKTPLTHCPVTRCLSVKGGLASVALYKENLHAPPTLDFPAVRLLENPILYHSQKCQIKVTLQICFRMKRIDKLETNVRWWAWFGKPMALCGQQRWHRLRQEEEGNREGKAHNGADSWFSWGNAALTPLVHGHPHSSLSLTPSFWMKAWWPRKVLV